MNEDDYILVYSFIGYWLFLGLLIYKSKHKIKTGAINLVIHISYSSYFLVKLLNHSQYGSGLLWFVCLIFIIWLHSLIHIISLILKFMISRAGL